MKSTHTPTRGERNCNPLNIRHSKYYRWEGERAWPDADGFCVFTSLRYGLRACFALLRSYRRAHGLRTLREIISRWAPPVENHTEKYIKWVSEQALINPDEEVIYNQPNAVRLVMAMAVYESKMLLDQSEVEQAQKLIL